MVKGAKKPRLFNGRDESWMQFNRRVLEEAEDPANPLLERVKFLAITCSNLDEYVEIRQAGLMQRIEDGYGEPGYDGLRPGESLTALTSDIHAFVDAQYACWNDRLLPELRKAGIRLLDWDELDDDAKAFAQSYYVREVDPLLTPIAIDPAHPFPRVLNKALCLALLLRAKRKSSGPLVLGVVTVPRALPRFVRMPAADGAFDYVLLQDLIAQNLQGMYRGYEVLAFTAFRVTRNSNLYFEEEEARSLLETIRVELHNRRKGDAVRLEIETPAHPEIVERLRTNFELEEDQVFRGKGPVNLSRVMFLYSDVSRPDLKFLPFTPRPLLLSRKATNIFEDLRTRDILLHHPYDSYDPVVNFIQLGAQDPAVVSIKQTLYRTSQDSPLFQAFIEAAATKEATVVVELMARFDEATNIRWARSMEDAGVQVFHGVVGLKTHCKLALLVRRDEDGVTRRYCHLGTGNYNPVTARFYTDLSLLTSDAQITERVHTVFNYLTAHAEVDDYRPLLVAPLTMAESFLGLIRREAEHARAGRPAHIVAKMNALLEPSVIECALPGVAGGRGDRPDHTRDLDHPAGGEGIVGQRPRAFDCGPVPGALAHFSFCQRRRRRDLSGLGGLDAAQPVRALRGGVPGARCGGQGAHSRRDFAGIPGRQREGAHPAGGRNVSPRQQVQQGRAGVFRAGFPDAAGGGKGGPGSDSRSGRREAMRPRRPKKTVKRAAAD